MSGPKTSHISIQEQIRQRLAAADQRISDAISAAEVELARQRDEVLSGCAALSASGDAGQAIAAEAKRECARAQEELHALGRNQARLRSLSSMDQIEAEAQRIVDAANAIASEAALALDACEREMQAALRRAERISEARGFAQMLANVLASAPHGDAAGSADAQEAPVPAVDATVTSWDDIADAVGDASVRYAALMAHPEYLPASAARVLVKHGAAFFKAVQACVEDPGQMEFVTASNHAHVMLELLPTFEREADAMRRVLAQVDALAAGLPFAQERPSAFATLDEADRYLEELKQARAASVEQRYIQSCIDDLMGRHGYDIARSVTLERSAGGENLIFGRAGAEDGIHVFVSDEGDMMMEAVGIKSIEDVPDAASVSLDKADEDGQVQFLLEVQEGFCSVYAELEAELAEYGISMDTINRCAPDGRFSKEVRVVSASDEGHDAAPEKSRAMPSSARKRRRSASQREQAL